MPDLQEETENVLLAMEHIKGRRPATKLELYSWLIEFDDDSRRFVENFELVLGSKLFEETLNLRPLTENIH